MAGTSQSRGRAAGLFVRVAVLVGLVAPLLVLAGAVMTKTGMVDWRFGFGTVTVDWASKAAMVGTAVGLLAVLAALTDFRRLWPWALVALLAPGLVLAGFAKLRADAGELPPIHDVATNWDEPLVFTRAFAARRAGADNPVEPDPVVPPESGPPWGGRRIAEINAETCPGARPVERAVDAERVREVLEAEGIEVFGVAPWVVEGTHESWWFGFKDDVIVRIRPERTDVRSISRVGRSDLGANCRRVTRIVAALGEE